MYCPATRLASSTMNITSQAPVFFWGKALGHTTTTQGLCRVYSAKDNFEDFANISWVDPRIVQCLSAILINKIFYNSISSTFNLGNSIILPESEYNHASQFAYPHQFPYSIHQMLIISNHNPNSIHQMPIITNHIEVYSQLVDFSDSKSTFEKNKLKPVV